MKRDSVAKGGLSVALARAVGMGFSFLLFLALARQSEQAAAVFRTLAVFLFIAEFLGLLGTQRWLVVELAPQGRQRRQLFLNALAYALAVSSGIGLVYVIVSYCGVYDASISAGLRYAAAGALGSAWLLCIQSTLVGVGLSSRVALLNVVENIVRSGIGLALVALKASVLSIILVFVLTRWVVVIAGLAIVFRQLEGTGMRPSMEGLKAFARQTPQFAIIMASFLTIRNAGLILLPALAGTRIAASYVVPYQLYDLLLLLPTMLAHSASHMFASRAARSPAALRLAMVRMLSITSLYVLPLAGLALVLGRDVIVMLAGPRYLAAAPIFAVLMVAAPLITVDQVLSLGMTSSKAYGKDRTAVSIGATFALASTFALAKPYGALGAAIAFLGAVALTLESRLIMAGNMMRPRELFLIVWKPGLASLFACLAALGLKALTGAAGGFLASTGWVIAGVAGLSVYAAGLYGLGALSGARRLRMRRFLFRHPA
ncbi:MAG: hypothetical protein M0T84_04995 [Betaproteobacteria bacterium]|nr:hypothetical protein [Betaproteobacteria bacterium]